jgi:redox-sensitive bicupin YhaK (pirin superfamily)
MKKVLHKAEDRGHADHGWLKSSFSFSFAGYYDPSRVHFGMLRVLNDDIVAPGTGFGTHPHDNMEIISIPLSGVLEHADSTGNKEQLHPGELQLMTAGTGIKHSEYNPSDKEAFSLLQIWIFPRARGLKPAYNQKAFTFGKDEQKVLVSPEESEDTLHINQDAWLSIGDYEADKDISYALHKASNGAYLFVIEGSIEAGDEKLGRRDAIGISDTGSIDIKAASGTRLLIIEVPMN